MAEGRVYGHGDFQFEALHDHHQLWSYICSILTLSTPTVIGPQHHLLNLPSLRIALESFIGLLFNKTTSSLQDVIILFYTLQILTMRPYLPHHPYENKWDWAMHCTITTKWLWGFEGSPRRVGWFGFPQRQFLPTSNFERTITITHLGVQMLTCKNYTKAPPSSYWSWLLLHWWMRNCSLTPRFELHNAPSVCAQLDHIQNRVWSK